MNKFFATLPVAALTFSIFSGTALTNVSWAQTVPESVRAERLERAIAQEALPEIMVDIPETEFPKTTTREKSDIDDMFFTLQTVEFKDNTVIESDDLAIVFSDYIGKEISVGQLHDLVVEVTYIYRDKGYVLSQAYLPDQEIKDGKVTIHLIEGYIDDFTLDAPDGPPPQLLIDYAYKIKESKPLQMDVLEHYMLLANEIPGFTVTSTLKTSKDNVGAAQLHLKATRKMFSAISSVDNFGSRDVGPVRVLQSMTINPLSDRTDSFGIQGATTPKDGALKYLGLQYQKVVNTLGTKIGLLARYTDSDPQLSAARGGNQGFDGISKGVELSVTQPLVRKRHEQIDAYVKYDHNETQTKFDPAFNTLETEDRLRVLRLGMDMRFQDRLAAFNSINFELSHGLNVFNASRKQDNTSRTNGKGYGFTKFNVTFDRVQELSPVLSIATGFTGQYSPDRLLSYEEFGVGGRRFGRGYDSSEITGDSGAAAKIELRYDTKFESKIVKNLQFYSFYDFGIVHDRDAPVGRSKRQSLASVGLGSRFIVYNDLSADMFVALPISRSVASREGDGKDVRFMFAVTKPF